MWSLLRCTFVEVRGRRREEEDMDEEPVYVIKDPEGNRV